MFHTNNILNRMMGLSLLASLGFVTLFLVSAPALAQVAPPLGVAQQFGALGNSGVTGSAAPGTAVTGDVGSDPTAPAVVNFPPSTVNAPFTVHFATDGVTQQAHLDAIAAFVALSQPCDATYASGTDLGGMNLVPGVYCSLGSFAITGVLTLTGTAADVWIFRTTASTLTANIGSSVLMVGGSACNVYWQVGSSATLNGASFSGIVIADASITLGTGNLTGQALAGTGPTGAVTMSVGGNTIGGCSALVAPLPPPGGVEVGKDFFPATINAGGVSTLTIYLSNNNPGAATLTSPFTDNLPGGVTTVGLPTTTCGGPAPTVTATSVTLPIGATIPGGAPGLCTLTVNVTSVTGGIFLNTLPIGALATNLASNTLPASATLTVLGIATAVPTLNEWGAIIFMLLAGLGSVYYLRKHRRV